MNQLSDERKTELAEIIKQMRQLSNQFYVGAITIGNHPFIEFTGLMNEYIEACKEALKEGIDFT